MKKMICTALLGFSMLTLGCSRKVIVNTPEGRIEANKSGNQFTIESKEGKVTIGDENVTEKDLGVPFYPGATSQGGTNITENKPNSQGTFAMVTLVTKDPIEKVVSFYKAKLPATAKFTNINAGETKMAMFDQEEKNGEKGYHVQITQDNQKGETDIMITSGSGEKH